MATSLDINDLVQIFQNSNLDDLAKSKLEKLKNEQNKWQAEILNKWANLKIPVYSKADIRLLNDAVYNDTKKKNQARAKLREYYLRRGQLNAAAAVNDLPENSKSGKNCIMQEGKKTLGWEPNLTEWIVIENDTRTISISEFQNCIESCEFSQALNIPISMDKLLKEAEINGFSEDQIKELFLDFIKQFKPASLLTARTFSDSANEIIQFLISLVNTPSEVQKVREALKKISREPSTELIDSILKVKSLTSTLLLLNNPKSDRQRIDKRSTTAALDAIFDLVNNQVQEGLRMFKQRATETERDVTINSLVSEALRLEAIHGKPQESKYVSQKIQHADSLSSYFTYDRIGEGKRSRDRHFSREQSRDRRFSSKDRNSGYSNERMGSFRDKRFTISSKPESLTTQTLSREKSENFSDKPQRVESENEISPMVLCSFPGCAFFAEKVSESQQRDHLRLNHSNSEWTETSFTTINSAMSEAMELLQGIKEEKSAVLT